MTAVQPLTGVSVLVLEDGYYLADETRRTLESAGARVLGPCRDGAETLQTLQTERPQCALVDINLGEGPTFEPARALRSSGVLIILMTGYDAGIIPEDLKDAPCLHKPVDARRLISTVASACQR